MSKILDTLRGYLGASTDHGLQARVAELEGKLEQAKELHFDLWPYRSLPVGRTIPTDEADPQ